MVKKTQKIHPSDARSLELAKDAVSFNVHIRQSPNNKINEPAETLEQAIAIYDRLEAENKASGRKPIIYALLKDSLAVPMLRSQAVDQAAAKRKPTKATVTVLADAKPKAKAKKIAAQDAPAVKKTAKPKAEKPAKAAPKAQSKRAKLEADAANGKLPPKPDFSAETHKPFRKKLDAVIALVQAGDIAGLEAYDIEPKSSSRAAIWRYRNLAVIALKAKQAKAGS